MGTVTSVNWRRLLRFCEELLGRVGLEPADAHTVAWSLVQANLRGVDSHGVMRLPIYVKRMELGLVATKPRPRFTRTGPSTGLLDGDDGPGQVVALAAMNHAIELARETGVGSVAARNSNHFGAAAHFAMHAAEQGLIGLATTHAEADMVPYGGREPRLGTNPIAIAVPGGPFPLVLDMATSLVSMGKVMLAAKEGREIPAGWAVDADGNPCTDPARARAVTPMAGAKGYGLAVMVDLLCALLTGASFGTHIKRMYDHFGEPQRVAHLLLALDPARFVPLEAFTARVAAMVAELKATPPAPGFEEVLLPGEPEARAEATRRQHGIPLERAVLDDLLALGGRYGVRL